MTAQTGTESEAFKFFCAAWKEGNRAWNEGDFERAYATLPDDFVYKLSDVWPHARPLRGRAEVVAFFEDLHESFPETRSGPDAELIEVGERTFIAGFVWIGTGRSSGVPTGMEIWQLWELREDLVPARVTEFPDRHAALEAAGAELPVNSDT